MPLAMSTAGVAWLRDGRAALRSSDTSAVAYDLMTNATTPLFRTPPNTKLDGMWGRGELFIRARHPEGSSSIYRLGEQNRLQLIAHFDIRQQQSIRASFAVGGGYIYFIVSDRQADVSVADLIRR